MFETSELDNKLRDQALRTYKKHGPAAALTALLSKNCPHYLHLKFADLFNARLVFDHPGLKKLEIAIVGTSVDITFSTYSAGNRNISAQMLMEINDFTPKKVFGAYDQSTKNFSMSHVRGGPLERPTFYSFYNEIYELLRQLTTCSVIELCNHQLHRPHNDGLTFLRISYIYCSQIYKCTFRHVEDAITIRFQAIASDRHYAQETFSLGDPVTTPFILAALVADQINQTLICH